MAIYHPSMVKIHCGTGSFSVNLVCSKPMNPLRGCTHCPMHTLLPGHMHCSTYIGSPTVVIAMWRYRILLGYANQRAEHASRGKDLQPATTDPL